MAFMQNTDWQSVKLNRVLAAGLVECKIAAVEDKDYLAREPQDGDDPAKVNYPQNVLEVQLVLVQDSKTIDGEEVHAGFGLYPRFRKSLPTEAMKANGLTSLKDLPENMQTANRISEEKAKKFFLAVLGLPKNFSGDINAKVAEAGGLAALKDKPVKAKVSVRTYKTKRGDTVTEQDYDDFMASNGVAGAPF